MDKNSPLVVKNTDLMRYRVYDRAINVLFIYTRPPDSKRKKIFGILCILFGRFLTLH